MHIFALLYLCLFVASCSQVAHPSAQFNKIDKEASLRRDIKFIIHSDPEGAEVHSIRANGYQEFLGLTPLNIVSKKKGVAKFLITMQGYKDKELYIQTTRKRQYSSDDTSSCFHSHFYGYMLTGGIWNKFTELRRKDLCVGSLLKNYNVTLEALPKKS